MVSRAEVLIALRQIDRPVTPLILATYMGKSAAHVGDILRTLYFMQKVGRIAIPGRSKRYQYYPAGVLH